MRPLALLFLIASPAFAGTKAALSLKTALTTEGRVVQMVRAVETGVQTSTTVIPLDDTTAQSSEGSQFLSQAFTPKSASNTILIVMNAFTSINLSSGVMTIALFKDSEANCLAHWPQTIDENGRPGLLSGSYSESAGSTTERTYKLRFGPGNASYTMYLNDAPTYGDTNGKTQSGFTIYEIAP